jgi:hypothetical protein
VDIIEAVQKQMYLTSAECEKLLHTLINFPDLFQGQCGEYNGQPITLELLPESKPFYVKPFSIPKAHQQIMKDKLACLESIGLLTNGCTKFIIPKKNHMVCIINGFRGLNKCLKLSLYPMPKISDVFNGLECFLCTTTINLNMVYYSMPLSEQAKKLCVSRLPWGFPELYMTMETSSLVRSSKNYSKVTASQQSPLP